MRTRLFQMVAFGAALALGYTAQGLVPIEFKSAGQTVILVDPNTTSTIPVQISISVPISSPLGYLDVSLSGPGRILGGYYGPVIDPYDNYGVPANEDLQGAAIGGPANNGSFVGTGLVIELIVRLSPQVPGTYFIGAQVMAEDASTGDLIADMLVQPLQVVRESSDPDSDGDGVPDGQDNCPNVPNPDQSRHAWDWDGDCDIDIVDVHLFEACQSGPALPILANCGAKDLDDDDDVDQGDFGLFQLCFGGPDKAPPAGCGG